MEVLTALRLRWEKECANILEQRLEAAIEEAENPPRPSAMFMPTTKSLKGMNLNLKTDLMDEKLL